MNEVAPPDDVAAIADRLAIEHLLSRYPFLVDRQRFEELGTLFTTDGVFEGPVGEPGVGRSGVEEFFRHSATKPIVGRVPKLMRHHVTSQWVELVAPDEAQANSYFVAMTDLGPDHWGRYRDAIVKAGGAWLFRRRTLSVDGFVPGSWWEQNISGGDT
jgi:SnoaL-like domain